MANYNFDKQTERWHTGSVKYDDLQTHFGRTDLLPLWVADMDFETPPFIIDALRKRLEHPVMGYTMLPDNYWPTVAQWVEEHHGWRVDPSWMTFIPGIVKGIGMVINCLLKSDEKVIIQPPVYHPFRLVPLHNGREVVCNPLIETADGSYRMDFEQLAQVADEKCRLLILSNPHNPAGVVWEADVLRRLARFCYERRIWVVSDEIHSDMPLYGHRHIPFASVSDEAAAVSITFGAPSKTFNMAGIVSSYAIVPNDGLRHTFYSWLEANELNAPTLFAPIATMAAFTPEGEAWRRQMLRYVEDNVDFVIDFCARHIPLVRPWRPQASFLVWLDCRALNLSQDELCRLFVDKARLALNDGSMFGVQGIGFMRFNVGAPRAVIQQALERLSEAVRQLHKG